MEKHESRLLKHGEIFYRYFNHGIEANRLTNITGIMVDSNNFLHNLYGPAWFLFGLYYIHGQSFKSKLDWEIEVNRMKMLEEL